MSEREGEMKGNSSTASSAVPISTGSKAARQHTPTPWFWEPARGRLCTIKVRIHGGGSGEPIARFVELNDAAFIVRACNERADLLEALKAIARQELSADMSVDQQLDGDFEGAYDHMVEVARAALSKAS